IIECACRPKDDGNEQYRSPYPLDNRPPVEWVHKNKVTPGSIVRHCRALSSYRRSICGLIRCADVEYDHLRECAGCFKQWTEFINALPESEAVRPSSPPSPKADP